MTAARMAAKAAAVLQAIGWLLALPSFAVLFFGALALRFVAWFPPLEHVLVWGAALGLALLVGYALIKQAQRLRDSKRAVLSAQQNEV